MKAIVYFYTKIVQAMIEIQLIRENLEEVNNRLKKRNIDIKNILLEVLETDDTRKNLQHERDDKLSEANKLSDQIGRLYREGAKDEAEKIKVQSKEYKDLASGLDVKLMETEKH